MKKKILSFTLVMLMLFATLPISVFAEEIETVAEANTSPVVSVSSLYSYNESDTNEFRALPDLDGNFYLDISLNKAPNDESDVVVYYRTVDDSAVVQWGDYESVGFGAFVTLSKSNGYKARVTVESSIIDDGFYTSDENGDKNKDKLVTRRFIFELTSVEGDATLSNDKSKLYCYLRASIYHYQNQMAQMITDKWKSRLELDFDQFMVDSWYLPSGIDPNDPADQERIRQLRLFYDCLWCTVVTGDSYFWEIFANYGSYDDMPPEVEKKIREWLKIPPQYNSLYYTVDGASAINTPRIEIKGSHKDNINLSFDDEWKSYVQSGWCDLGISIYGDLVREYWDSDGPATFKLYYNYGGEQKLALTLDLQGEFDDSTFFGWEHAFEYAVEGLEGDNRDDHMDENFIGFTVYDNDGNEAYKVKINGRGELDEVEVCGQLKQTLIDGNAVEMLSGFEGHIDRVGDDDIKCTAYYLRLPSNFALADSYSYDFYTESTRTDSRVEIRWLENVALSFALIGNKQPMIAKDEKGNQMISTNLDTISEGDPLRMSVRFDSPVHIADPNGNCYVTLDIYNDKGSLLAKGVKLTLKQLAGEGYHYAWDTLVFEGDLPQALEGAKIASLRNIKIVDGSEDETNPTTEGIKSFFTELKILSKTIRDIYIDRDFRTPVATVNPTSTENWSKSKSIDVYLNVMESPNTRFNDYATVYYQWSNSQNTPETYSSKVIFNTKQDGEVLKTIIGTGNGEMYLHLKAVSSYGKSSVSGPFGPFKFDNDPPELTANQITVTGSLKDRIISVPLPDDNGGVGLKDISLYYIKKNGEETFLKNFTAGDFNGTPQTLTHTISHTDVGACVDLDGNPTFARETVEFYWVITDKLGNSSGKTAEFALVFDTNDYLDSGIESVGPFNVSGDEGAAMFESTTQKLDDFTYIYNYKLNDEKNFESYIGLDKPAYYAFSFTIKNGAFSAPGSTEGEDNGIYGVNLRYKGEELDDGSYTLIEDGEGTGVYVVLILSEVGSGRYDIQLTRTEGESMRVSQIYSVYATNGEEDATALKNKIEFGTLLSNTVYQLSTEYPYFYYKNVDGAIQKEYYNGTKQPATFSSFEKAKEYVYYKELSDIYLVQLSAATASALSSGTGGYLLAKGEMMVPEAGQYWIRYKSEAWEPTSGENAWVYYYYGDSGELNEGALSANLLKALSVVSTRIASYGKTVVLTDTSLFFGSAMGDKMLDEYGMPYLAPGQIHITDELAKRTVCGNEWTIEVGFAADKNIYKSKINVGVEGTEDYKEYPIVGNFELPDDSIFYYMTYEQYNADTPIWQPLNIKKGESFINTFTASGVYYIREIAKDGVSVFAIYIDKTAPEISFSNTDEEGNFKEIPVDGKEILNIQTKDLYIGSIGLTECDRLSYVAVYKVANLSLVGVYTVADLSTAPIQLEDGNYYIVVSDRSGNCYTVTAKVSSTDLECSIKESADKFIRLTCNRKNDQIQRYEVYLNGELVTSTYMEEQTFTKAGLYTIYVQDIYGNEFSKEYLFERNYPTVTWKYHGTDGKYHTYDPESASTNGFVMVWVSDNQYKISTAVKTRFSFSADYVYEFVGTKPVYSETLGTETTVTIEAGQSFTLKVYYKNHRDCYTVYTGSVDVTPPSINVSAEIDLVRNGEYGLFDEWVKGNVGDVITMNDLYYVLSEITHRSVTRGDTVTSDIIKINANDANALSVVEVYLDGVLLKKQDTNSGFSQITVNKWGEYRIVAKDTLGNVSEFKFTNGASDYFDYFVDGAEHEYDLHGYLNFETVGDKHVYNKIDYGQKNFLLNVKENADVFMSVGVIGEASEIYGFSISDGKIYPLTYKIVLDKDGNKAIDIFAGEAILDMTSKDFKNGEEYLISKKGSYAVYASIGLNKSVSFKVYAPEDTSKIVSVGARVEVSGSNTAFVCAELSKKISDVSFTGLGAQTNDNIRINNGFTIDESRFDDERISNIRLYYSRLNNLDVNNLTGKTNIYVSGREYGDEGFYLLIVQNSYGTERVYKIAVSKSFGITSSVTFGDGHKIYYSKDYTGTLYSNGEITLDVLDDGVTLNVTLNGNAYSGFVQKKNDNTTYLVFSEEGTYVVKLTDSYGNEITRHLQINKSAYTVSDELLTGYNDKALRRDEGYTNQMLSIDKTVYGNSGIYYLAVQYGETTKVLFDAFAESLVVSGDSDLINVIGAAGDGVYRVICRNRYGAVVTKDIHYRGTPTLHLERTTRSKSEKEEYDLSYAISLGFWSNNTLSFLTDAKTYIFTVNGNATECPRTLVFENAGDFGSFEYVITYIDEYGFEYNFKAYLVRQNVAVDIPSSVVTTDIGGVLNTKNDISISFGENVYATYRINNGEEVIYHSGDVLKKDGTYRFIVVDYAGNATSITIKKDTAVEFSLVDSISGNIIPNGSVVNSSKISFSDLNKDGAYIEKVIHNGVIQSDFTGSKFTEDGKWELIVCDKIGNRAYFSFYIVTHSQNGFAYTTPYEYRIIEMWYDGGDGVKVSYMTFVNHLDSTSSFNFTENGKYSVVMASDVTGITTAFEFTVNTTAPAASLVGCNNGETTINDVTLTGYQVGDSIKIYRETKMGEELVVEVEITSLATKVPTITEGGKYRIVVESEAGVQTEFSIVRKHVMNTAGSVFVMVLIGLSVVGLFTGLVYRNKSKTDD